MTWILIIIINTGHSGAMTNIEFKTKTGCEQFKKEFKKQKTWFVNLYCIEKGL